MADVNLGQVAATVWEKVIGTKPNDNIFTSFALFKALGKDGFKESAAGGRLFEFTLEYNENSTFKSYGELETLDTTRIDVFDAARYDWKINAGTVVFSDLEELRAAGEGKIDLTASKMENARNSHMATMNRQCFSDGAGNGGKDIEGLTKIISETPTTGTVGGINRATFSFWRNKAADGGQTSADFDNLRSALTSVYNQCSRGGLTETPTAVITSRTVMEGLEGTVVAVERYEKPSATPRGFSVGFKNAAFMFKDAEVFYDEDCSPSDSAYLVNPKFLKFVYLKGAWMKLKPRVEPANQLAVVSRLFTIGNLATNNSRRLGVVFDIS
ncbi:MAG: phage major capsid protein [Luteitalea sp.]|nr:phage major capsid protein [Luteitalea sp.]